MTDVRNCLALFAGLALVSSFRFHKKTLVRILVVATTACAVLATCSLLAVPGAIQSVLSGARLTTQSGFMLLTPAMILFPSATILAVVTKWRWGALSSALVGVLLWFESATFLQTRSTLVAVSFALLLTGVGVLAWRKGIVGRWPPRRRRWGRWLFLGIVVCVGLGVVARVDPTALSGGVMSRFGPEWTLESDATWVVRAGEIEEMFAGMSPAESLAGLGVGPTPVMDYRGDPVFSLHIGWMNIWWRFGLLAMSSLTVGCVALFWKWARTVIRIRAGRYITMKDIRILVGAPGILTVAAVASISGGWGPAALLPLGVCWGLCIAPLFEPAEALPAARGCNAFNCLLRTQVEERRC